MLATGEEGGADDAPDLLVLLGDAVRDSGVTSRVAIDELCVEIEGGSNP